LPAIFVLGREARRAIRRSADEHEARASERGRTPVTRRKAAPGARFAALGNDETRVFDLVISECRSRSDATPDRDARRRYQAPREHARSSSKEDARGALDERHDVR